MNDPFAPVVEIMRRHGTRCSAEEFHSAVNINFHRFESEQYDELHRDMWESLPQQVALLADDCLRGEMPASIKMLDIGCGTGLATDSLLKSPLGPRITEVDLLDTSTAMLARAVERRKAWGKPGENIEGLVNSLVGRKQYNLIITSSVLHHVPDLQSFLAAVTGLQKGLPGRPAFLHLQDPNGDFLDHEERRARSTRLPAKKMPEWLARLAPQRIMGRLMRELKGEQGTDYLSRTNQELVKAGLIETPLSTLEIFTITDIHAQDGEGISIERMNSWLPDYDLAARRSYAFFGSLWSTLPPNLRYEEERLIREGALEGEYVSAVWRLRE
jgi:SAM-dependent methyltransferase